MPTDILSRRELGFYVYVHRRATDNSIFYVGKGKAHRAWSKNRRTAYWKNIVAKHGLTVEIVALCETEEAAFGAELGLIQLLRTQGVLLANMTDGGEGPSGMKHSAATKALWAAIKTGKKRGPYSAEHRAKISESQIGKDVSEETRRRISEATKAAMRSPEIVEKMRAAKLGKKRQPHSEETKARIRAASLGRPKSEAARQAMSVAQRKRFAKEAQGS